MRIILRLTVLSAILILCACTHIAPWERGILAKPQMALDPYPMQRSLRAHNYGSREAAPAGNSLSGGGGCGCY